MTFEYNSRPNVESLIPQVLRRVLELAAALRIERLALPVLISGGTGVPKSDVIARMARSLACYLVGESHALREVTIAIYKGGTPDHAEIERKRAEELAPVREQVATWAFEAAPINTRLALLQQLCAAAAADRELHDLLASRIAADRRALCRLFDCPDDDARHDQYAAERPESAPRNRQEYEFSQHQLTILLADLDEEAEHLNELRRVERRRLHSLERQAAQQGAATGPAIITEIEDITRTLDQRERQIQQIKEQRAVARQDLDLLERGWRAHQS
jgi:hypothetical protein